MRGKRANSSSMELASLRPYPEYKDSGVPWLGKIPTHWVLQRGKFLFQYAKQLNINGLNKNVLSLTLRGVVNNDPDDPEGLVPKDYATYQFFKKSDLVFKLIDLENLRTSRVGLVHQDGIMSPAYIRLVPNEHIDVRYFFYQFFDLYLRSVFNKLGAGVRATLGPSDLLNIVLLVPSTDEQQYIVRFLDNHEYLIRRFIRAKRRMIELLNEQKQAIINQAVTRGLDPNVRLKPSGIGWLGEVPEHWEVKRLMSIFRERKQRGRNDLPILIVSLNTGVTVGDEIDEDGRPRRLIEDRSNYKLAMKGDVAYNMMRMWQGAVGTVPVDGLVSPAYVVAKPVPDMNSVYFALVFRTEACKSEINSNSRGIVSDRNRLYWEDFKNLYVPVPDPHEQDQIIDSIELKTRKINDAISSATREINLIREYRERLIADVVTGKVDVRHLAASLPAASEVREELAEVDIEESLIENEEPIEEEEIIDADD